MVGVLGGGNIIDHVAFVCKGGRDFDVGQCERHIGLCDGAGRCGESMRTDGLET